MKANKAPEKIYLYPSDRAGEEYENEWGAFPWGEGSVEYVRTDTFIEKACKWLKENKDHPFIGCEDCCLSGFLTDEFIEEFRKAMEE